MQGIRIVRTGISVYEVEVDLGKYASLSTAQVKGFTGRLLRLFPSLGKHECCAGEAGGFVEELKKGTDFAHVMEHLIIEMLKVTCRRGTRLSGWTRKKSKNYVIHFQAPDSSAGRRAALSAKKVVEGILEGKPLRRTSILRELKQAKGVEH